MTLAGAESVLQSIYKLYPGTIYTLFHDPEGVKGAPFADAPIYMSMLQRLPFGKKHHRAFLPLYPMAIEQFDLRDHDLVISSSYAVAKGVLTSSDQLHICYCHSPMRYVWDLTFQYLEASGLTRGLKSFIARAIFHYIRLWDASSAIRVNEFVANSHYIAHRIQKCYNRTATVIYPPVDVDKFSVGETKDSYFITMSRLVPYKRIDLIIQAFNELRLPLLVVGDGPARRHRFGPPVGTSPDMVPLKLIPGVTNWRTDFLGRSTMGKSRPKCVSCIAAIKQHAFDRLICFWAVLSITCATEIEKEGCAFHAGAMFLGLSVPR